MARKILIATPGYGGQITVPTCQSVTQAIKEGAEHGWEVRWLPLVGTADLAKVRNYYLGFMRKSSIDDILYVDADISWGPGTFAHIMSHKVDVVAGVYATRSDDVSYPVIWPEERQMRTDPITGKVLLKAVRTPAGFLRITRGCIEQMAEHPSTRTIISDCWEVGIEYPFLFEWVWVLREDGIWERRSEDYTFCDRWVDMGGTVWVDPALKFGHTGQKTYPGDLMAHLQGEVMGALPAFDPVAAARAALAIAGVAA